VPLTAGLVQEALDPALTCLANYKGCQVLGWTGPEFKINNLDLMDTKTGLDAGLYFRNERGSKQSVLCFRGAETKVDWRAAFDQAFGQVPEQFRQAFRADKRLCCRSGI
jgi:hypothetical protein